MGARSRTKGKVWERDVVKMFLSWFPGWPVRRGFQSRAGDDEADVEGTPLWVECKVGQRPNVISALRQAEEATDGRPVLVVIKRNRQAGEQQPEVFVAMRAEDFGRLLRCAVEGGWK